MSTGLSRRQGMDGADDIVAEEPRPWVAGLPDPLQLHDSRNHIFKVAIISRLITCGCLLLSELLWPEWLLINNDPSVAHIQAPRGLRAFAQWDAARFLLAARDGYLDEQSFAFQPGLPFLMWLLQLLCPIKSTAGLIICGLLWTNMAFVVSAVFLVELGYVLEFEMSFAHLAAILYCAGPATLFHSSVYSESPFALCTIAGCIFLGRGMPWKSVVAFALGSCFRANGIVNSGFLLFEALTQSLIYPQKCGNTLRCLSVGIVQTLIICAPFFIFQGLGYWRFCQVSQRPEWCEDRIPSIYGHIQKKYWGNGLFAFWELKQIPNFIRAAPPLAITFAAVYRYFQYVHRLGLKKIFKVVRYWTFKSCDEFDDEFGSFRTTFRLIPFAVQAGALALLVLLEMHVHVAGRFLSAASPFFHWAVAWAYRRNEVWVRRFLWLDFILGAVLHPNGLPWP
mmetsp:Transcript_74574/g.155473  ORF Transcript_74574/g.155473 Transcript_74574/m.155473 type:complete len:451 (-) Transcript_74574:56-1408(-)